MPDASEDKVPCPPANPCSRQSDFRVRDLRRKALYTHKPACKLDSLVRVSRRVECSHFLSKHPSHKCSHGYSHAGGSYHVLHIFLTRETMLTGKARHTAHCLLKTYCHTYDGAASTGVGCVQQSRQDMVASLTSFSVISSTFTFHFKVLFTSPSWYVLAIGLEPNV